MIIFNYGALQGLGVQLLLAERTAIITVPNSDPAENHINPANASHLVFIVSAKEPVYTYEFVFLFLF